MCQCATIDSSWQETLLKISIQIIGWLNLLVVVVYDNGLFTNWGVILKTNRSL